MNIDEETMDVESIDLRLSTARFIRIQVARFLFHKLIDGFGDGNERAKRVMWSRIDRELKGGGFTRDDL